MLLRIEEDAWLPVLVTGVWVGLLASQVDALFGRAPALGNKAKALDQLMLDTERLTIARSRTVEVHGREDR